MCIAIYKPEGKIIPYNTLKECYDANPDGAGFMYAEDKVLHIQVNKPLELNLFSIDGKLLVKQYYQTGIQHINVNQYAHATYLLSSGRLTKKIIL